MARAIALVGMLVWILSGGLVHASMRIEAEPAWDGWLRAGMPSEVAVRLVSDRGGPVTLELKDRSVSYRHQGRLEPDEVYTWRVPLIPPSSDVLQLVVNLEGQPVQERQVTLHRHLSSMPLVAVVSSRPVRLEGVQAAVIHVSGNDVPHHHSSFEANDLVVIHRDLLRTMNRRQLLAMRQHTAACGRIVITGVEPAALEMFSAYAGCGARFLAVSESDDELAGVVTRMLERQVPQLPSLGSLNSLLSHRGTDRRVISLTVFFALNLLVLLIALRSPRAPAYFAGISVAATGIMIAAWAVNPADVQRIAWAEMERHLATARFTLLHRVVGNGSPVTINVPRDLGPMQALQPTRILVERDSDGDGSARLSFTARLLSEHEFLANGVAPMAAPLRVDDSESPPRVTNTGLDRSPPALLAWNDLKYPVPPLIPEETWTPPPDSEPWGADPVEHLFRQRAMNSRAALLFRNPEPGRSPAGAEQFYLMVRP